MKKIYLFPILLIGLIFLTACSTNKANNKINMSTPNQTSNPTTNQTANQPTASVSQTLTLTEVAKHTTVDDCWMVVNNQVYDLSSYTKAGKHPGGETILKGCGQEATEMFKAIEKHSGRATNMLPQYLLGTLQ